MDETVVTYRGRVVPKEGFRAFIYHEDGQKKIVESWDEYMQHKDLEWFDTPEEAEIKKDAFKILEEQKLEKNNFKKLGK